MMSTWGISSANIAQVLSRALDVIKLEKKKDDMLNISLRDLK